jgi:hypothetical protein
VCLRIFFIGLLRQVAPPTFSIHFIELLSLRLRWRVFIFAPLWIALPHCVLASVVSIAAAGRQEGARVRLEDLGWNAYFEGLWSERFGDEESGIRPARVVSQQRGLWRVAGEFGDGRKNRSSSCLRPGKQGRSSAAPLHDFECHAVIAGQF